MIKNKILEKNSFKIFFEMLIISLKYLDCISFLKILTQNTKKKKLKEKHERKEKKSS